MSRAYAAALFAGCVVATFACGRASPPPPSSSGSGSNVHVDAQLASFINGIRAVDNHTHVNSTAVPDPDFDALPLDGLPPFDLPVRLRPDDPQWIAAFRGLYGYPHSDLSEPHLAEMREARARVMKEQGDKYPTWVLDKIGTDVMLANRIAMGPGVAPPRFRWVSYVDALMLPLPTAAEAAVTPDRAKLYPLEDQLLHRYLTDLHLTSLPSTLEEYQRAVVTATLERQRQGGCIAVKFEAAYLRSLDFREAPPDEAGRIYARYASGGGQPSRPEYKTLQDYLFRYISREAGRLGMAVHIHSFEGAGGYFGAAGADPLFLENAFNDESLRHTKFVIVHGGGIYATRAGAMLMKPNVYLDFSMMPVIYSAPKLAGVLREWFLQYPEKVLFGTDASPLGPDIGWEVLAWTATATTREALGIALSAMIDNGEITRDRAQQIATMVMRTTAGTLYNLSLH
jgi:uncharacterized protein